jgi:protease I
MGDRLRGKRVLFLATDGVEQVELTDPWDAVLTEGGTPVLGSIKGGQVQGVHHDEKGDMFHVDVEVGGGVSVGDYAGLVLPGGVMNPDALRMDEDAVHVVQEFAEAGKPIAAICHGPWLLVEAGLVEGRKLTSWPSLHTDIENAGGQWVDEQVVVDSGLVTSRKPDDLAAFCGKMIEEICEGVHESRSEREKTKLA